MKMLSRFLSDERSSLLNRAINFREIEWSETIFLLTHFQYFCILHFLFSETGQPNSSSKESSRRHPTAKLSFMRLVNVFGKMTRERKGKMDIIIKVINLKSPKASENLKNFHFGVDWPLYDWGELLAGDSPHHIWASLYPNQLIVNNQY